MLALKRKHPLPPQPLLPETFDLSLDRTQQCPTDSQYDSFAAKYPLWGMPYGLPGVTDEGHRTLMRWIEQGAPYREPDPGSSVLDAQVEEWEAFLNGDSPKHRLMSRYLYEHLSITHLYFDDLPERQWFRLVRSRSAPGQPMEQQALPEFIAAVAGLSSEADYHKLAERFAVRRTSPDF